MAFKALHNLAPMNSGSYISTRTPAPPALPWMPSPELLFLSQFPLPGCSLLLCKENLHSAFKCYLFREASPDLLIKASHFLTCVPKALRTYFHAIT